MNDALGKADVCIDPQHFNQTPPLLERIQQLEQRVKALERRAQLAEDDHK